MFTLKAAAFFSGALVLLTIAILLDDFEIGVLVLGLASIFFICNLWGLPENVTIRLDRNIVPAETFGGATIRIESII